MKKESILVIGGGIAGIQASLDLAKRGLNVILVEKEPFIGGKSIFLSKILPLCGRCLKKFNLNKRKYTEQIFANNDCSICVIEPKIRELESYQNIRILNYSEVTELKGDVGDFKVKILKKSKFVDSKKCIDCGVCVEICPVNLKQKNKKDFDGRKAINLPIPQTIPRTATIDKDNCLFLQKNECGKCKEICPTNAINFEIKDNILDFNVNSVIVATGFDVYNPIDMSEYGYGKFDNVYTAMEYERLTSRSGPTKGELIIPPENKKPQSIAFIQCVGARDLNRYPYCCSVCCMHATKEALLTNDLDKNIKTYIFYTDLRKCGKNFYEYVNRGIEEYNITYIRSKPGEIIENKKTKKLTLYYDEENIVKRLEVDMVVLSTALIPSECSKGLAKILDIELDENGFFKIKDKLQTPVDSTKNGIFLAGFCESPKDIPECVAQGSASAGRVFEVLKLYKN